MKKLVLLLSALFMFSAFAIEEISVGDLKDITESNANDYVVIDVRTPAEYEAGHIEGAVLIPLQVIENQVDYITENFGDQKIYLICRSGRRSSIAYGILEKFNLNVFNVKGGMNAWNSLSH